MYKAIAIIFVLTSGCCFAQTDNVKFKHVSPYGYSQYAEVDLGNSKMIVMSGQVAFDKDGNLVGKDNLALQLQQTFTNIKGIVEEAGGTMSNVVKLNYYLTDISQIKVVREVRDKIINTTSPPASTAVQIAKLF